MSNTAYIRVLDKLRGLGLHVQDQGTRATAQCPAHDDHTPSLSITQGDQNALIYCFAGCDFDDVLQALDMERADLYDNPHERVYPYVDLSGRFLGTTTRHKNQKGDLKRFTSELGTGTNKPLYRLPEVAQAVSKGTPVHLVEGEKDADNGHYITGAVFTTAPGGATSFKHADISPLHGANVIAVVDKDTAGDKWANQVHTALHGVAKSLVFKQAHTGKDLSDHLATGGTLDTLDTYTLDISEQTTKTDSGDATQLEYLTNSQYLILKAKHQARERYEREKAEKAYIFDVVTMSNYEPLKEPERIPGLVPSGGFILVSAMRKTGKTTLVMNLMRSLISGDPFLDRYTLDPEPGKIAYLDYEMPRNLAHSWLTGLGVDTARVKHADLKGRKAWISSPRARDLLAQQLEGCSALVVDSFSKAFTGSNQNDPGEVSDWLEDLHGWARDTLGVNEVYLIAHAGKDPEKGSRGASSLEDKPDNIIYLASDSPLDPQARRKIWTLGRMDNDLTPHYLDMDAETKRLRLGGETTRGNNSTDKEGLRNQVKAVIEASPGINVTEIRKKIGGRTNAVSEALATLEARGDIRMEPGAKNSKKYYPVDVATSNSSAVVSFPEQHGNTTTFLCPACDTPLDDDDSCPKCRESQSA